jgi:acetylornithine deacetylase
VLTLERRTLPGETVADVELEVTELLDRCRTADPELVASSRVLLSREPFETDASSPLVASVSSAATGVLGRPAEIVGVSYWSDAAFISAAGIPTVVFGPAGDGAHADVEWVSLSGTVVCTKALIDIAKDICA